MQHQASWAPPIIPLHSDTPRLHQHAFLPPMARTRANALSTEAEGRDHLPWLQSLRPNSHITACTTHTVAATSTIGSTCKHSSKWRCTSSSIMFEKLDLVGGRAPRGPAITIQTNAHLVFHTNQKPATKAKKQKTPKAPGRKART